jgi:cell division protein FtsW
MAVIILSIFSVLAVYSSTGTLAYKYQSGNTEYYLFKHFIILVFGFLLMYGAHHIKYTYYSRISQLGIYLAIPLLFFTLISGTNLNSASRWLTLPVINLSFQTSDFAKLTLILYLARLLSRKQDNIKDFKLAFVPIMIPIVLVCALIMPANLSTAAVLFTTSLFLMFIGRISIKYILILIGAGALFLSMFIGIALLSKDHMGEGSTKRLFVRVDTWINRVTNFASGEDNGNYQTQQAKMAIASGGIIGKGPRHCVQTNTLPHPYSDFIYAVIIGEWGMLGGGFILLLYLILFYRSVRIATKLPRAFASLLAVGCSFSLVFQAMINMAVAVNIFPVTGQSLPLISMGGTSIWFTSIAIGIILSVSREVDVDKEGGVDVAT